MSGKHKDLEEATAFALKYCNPEDNEVISDLDRHTRETAWALLQKIKSLEAQKCICEECGSEGEVEEASAEDVEEIKEDNKVEAKSSEKTVVEVSETSTLDKLSEIAENNKELLKKATKTVAGVGAVAATTQTAAAATTPTLTAATTTFFQEAGQKIASIGTAGIMSIGSGAYFQAKTVKAEGIEIAVVSEQEYGVFSKFNQFTQSTLGVSAFENIVKYAEEGYGDIEGTGPPSEGEGGIGSESEDDGESGGKAVELSDEEKSARAEEAAEKKKELEDKGILPKIDEELEEDKPVTELGG